MSSPEIKFKEKYSYNEQNDTYILNMKHRVKPFVMKGFEVRSLRKNISNFFGNAPTYEEICNKFGISQEDLDGFKRCFEISHNSFPLTDEEMNELTPEQIQHKLLQEKKVLAIQEFNKKDWKELQKDAVAWREFQHGNLDLIRSILNDWQPPKFTPVNISSKPVSPKTLIFVISDTHCGALLDEKLSTFSRKWNVKEFRKFVENYKKQSTEILQNGGYDKVVVLFLGDLLDGLRGHTEKGTILTQDVVRDRQFKEALNGFTSILENFIKHTSVSIEIHNTRGNHDSVCNFILFEAIGAYFKGEDRLKLNNHSKRNHIFKEKTSLFIIEHGAADVLDAKIPKAGKGRESYIQSLLLQYGEKNSLPKYRYFVQGDLHHFETCEYNDFEFIMCGTPAKSLYSDVNNWRSRPSQLCLTVTNKGVEEIKRLYFD